MDAPTNLVEALSELKARPLSWLWAGRLARGKLSIFDGDPEIGKSLITLDLCARITTGRPFPDGAPGLEPSNVLIMNGEDGTEDTVIPRLRAMGADLTRAFVFRKDIIDKSGPFRLPTHVDFLDGAMAQTNAVFAVLDPIMAFLDPSIQVASDASVRRALRPLGEISEERRCQTSLVRHLNKTGHFRSMYRGGGSIGLVAACRSCFLCARDPEDPARAVLAQVKNNLGPRQPSLAYRVQVQEAGLPVLEWLGQSPLSADQLLAAAGIKPYQATAGDRAREFLLAFLGAGPRTTLDIWEAAREKGHAKRTLQRVCADLEIRAKAVWENERTLTYWLLRGQQLPAGADPADPEVPSLEPWLKPLREKYPRNPLEEL